jgi:hypothetical protein
MLTRLPQCVSFGAADITLKMEKAARRIRRVSVHLQA